MARKMTFTLPDELAAQLLRRVPAQSRSRYVAEALASRLREREDRLIRSCEVANHSTTVQGIEDDWDALRDEADELQEPWNDAAPR